MDYERIYVDGHSLIFAWPELTKLHRRSPQLAREQLVSQLTRFQDAIHLPVTVVFDGGKRVRSAPREPSTAPLDITYSEPGETADAVIERRVGAHRRGSRLLVVTNDRVEQLTVEAMQAETMSAESFAEWLERESARFDRHLDEIHRKARRYRKFP